jgi:hypothetical protein
MFQSNRVGYWKKKTSLLKALFAGFKATFLDLQSSKTPHLLDYCQIDVRSCISITNIDLAGYPSANRDSKRDLLSLYQTFN